MGHGLRILENTYGIRPTGIIHVGANTGQEVPVYRSSGVRPVVMIEPLTEPFAELVRVIGDTPGLYPLKTCLSDVADKTVDFHVASNQGQSSSYLRPAAHIDICPGVTFDRTETMVTDTLDRAIAQLCQEQEIHPECFDYIGLDTQGSEMDILRGGARVLSTAKYVFTEVNFGNLYAGDTSLYGVIELMRGWGFDLYQLSMNDRGWGDALFMRRKTLGRSKLIEARARRRRRAARRLRALQA